MDASRVDALTRTPAAPGNRRRLIGGLVAGAIGLTGVGRAGARFCGASGTT